MTQAMDSMLLDGPANARWTIALAHGAGMDSPFMGAIAAALAGLGRVARPGCFEMMGLGRGKTSIPGPGGSGGVAS